MLRASDLFDSFVILWLFAVALAGNVLWFSPTAAAPSPDLWPRWQAHVEDSIEIVDHRPWDMLLQRYLVTDDPSGINRFRYADVSPADRQVLDRYLEDLQQVRVSSLNRREQKAFWINMYNGLTVQVILGHYPVKSIRDIDISPGLFSNGPWDAKLLVIENEKISLNDIEHHILRPIFKDNRIHYALNCASLGCPDLQPVAYTAANTDELLEAAAKAFINSPRGARLINGRLQVSTIYKWFEEDFGGSAAGVISHLLQYADVGLADVLRTYNKGLRYSYDWTLNGPE